MARLIPVIVVSLLIGAPAQAEAPGPSRAITAEEAASWKPHLQAAKEYAKNRSGDIGIAVVDMRGRLHEWRGYGTAHMASTFKVMLLAAYLRRHDVRHRRLTEREVSLLRPMIRVSDDNAATAIRNTLGEGPIQELANDAHMHSFKWNDIWGYCRTSARDQAYFLRRIRDYIPKRHWSFARRQLEHVVRSQRWGFGKVHLHGWRLMFKGGWGSGSGLVDHQVARLHKDGQTIGVAILTENDPDHEYGKATIEGVAKRLLSDLP